MCKSFENVKSLIYSRCSNHVPFCSVHLFNLHNRPAQFFQKIYVMPETFFGKIIDLQTHFCHGLLFCLPVYVNYRNAVEVFLDVLILYLLIFSLHHAVQKITLN